LRKCLTWRDLKNACAKWQSCTGDLAQPTSIVVHSSDSSGSESDIMTALNEKLARNGMNKVQKNLLRQTYNTIYENKAWSQAEETT